ncbi:hypothetical protein [Taibaiella koreensis]|uniref:hypothetical protein n=1 Tax=Taibaiella koreensis TaxID=1268548 RepID=UPI000E59B57A|nr:hypothetical protein [Taibaiella koreensis]
MNIEYANTIPMPAILAKLGLHAVQEQSPLYIYPSPFHKDKRLTLHINTELNIWFDSETGISGNPVDFLKAYLKLDDLPCSHVDAIDWLKANIGYPSMLEGIDLPDAPDDIILFKYKAPVTSAGLIRYLEQHYISLKLARKHFVEIGYAKGKGRKEVYALGMKTICEGYAMQSQHINGFIGIPGITVIKPNAQTKPGHIRNADKPKLIHVFKDSFDYLTALRINGKLFADSEVIILHDYRLLDQSANYIRSFGPAFICTWFDNGEIGKQATKNYAFMCSTQEHVKHFPQNGRYISAYDVNAHFISIAEGK